MFKFIKDVNQYTKDAFNSATFGDGTPVPEVISYEKAAMVSYPLVAMGVVCVGVVGVTLVKKILR